MKINVGVVVSMKHYSSSLPLQGKVLHCSDNSVSIHILGNDNSYSFSKNDPVAMSFSSEKKIYVLGGSILDFDSNKKILSLSIEKIDLLEEKRLFERFPLSRNCNIQIGQSLTKYPGIIKNMSLNGLMILCDAEFPIYQKLKISFDIGSKSIDLTCIVIRKNKLSPTHSEYCLKIHYVDETTPRIIKGFLLHLKKQLQ